MKKLLALLVLLAWPSIGYSILGLGDIVLDPTNLVQTTLTASRAAISNANEASQLAQQLQSYAQQAKHLIALPVSYIDQIMSLYQQYTDVLNQGRGMSYTFSNSVSQFESLFQSGFNGNGSMMERARQMINQVREAGRAATAVTAIFDRLCADQTNVRTLITASQSAPGTLAAMQAQAQLTAVLSDQQASLQQIAATTSRAQVGFIMREVTAEEHAQWNAQQFMQGFGDVSFRGPHEGQGFTLPR